VTHGTTIALAALGVLGQVLVVLVIIALLAAAVGVGRPLRALRSTLWGYELWAAFLVAAVATGGSLFSSEIAGYVPCELCWYQRICMYPLSLLTLFAAATMTIGSLATSSLSRSWARESRSTTC
jgi:hypothetical protein